MLLWKPGDPDLPLCPLLMGYTETPTRYRPLRAWGLRPPKPQARPKASPPASTSPGRRCNRPPSGHIPARILEAFADRREFSITDAATAVGTTYGAAATTLTALRAFGCVERVRRGVWRVVSSSDATSDGAMSH